MADTIISITMSITGIAVGIYAIWQSYRYNELSKSNLKETEKIQKYIENTISYSNIINMYSFLNTREIAKMISDKHAISLAKDTVILNKQPNYSKKNKDECLKIIWDSNTIKTNVYGKTIDEFLENNDQTVKITLKNELSKNNIEEFMSMSSHLLEHGITVLHCMHF